MKKDIDFVVGTVPFRHVALMLAALAILAYLPTLSLPFISDDYVQIDLARKYGPLEQWGRLTGDALYRCRATSLLLTHWTEELFGLNPLAFNLSSLVLHLLNVWLIFALGFWKEIGWRYSVAAAAFFAVHEGLQEAVVWYAAIHEPLHLTFALLCLHLWLRWLQRPKTRFYVAGLGMFVLALLSKESAVAIVPLMVLLAILGGAALRRVVVAALPFATLALFYFFSIYAARDTHLHFNDVGTFSLSAPFWITWRNSMGRLFWIWGWLSVVALLAIRPRANWRLPLLGAAWAGISLVPYSFLTYMPRVPSRHTYFAAVGLSLVVAAGFWQVRDRFQSRAWVSFALGSVILLHNCLYLWVRKLPQYLERAEPTERLVTFAAGVEGPVYIHCFPYGMETAILAVGIRLGKAAHPMVSGRSLSEFKDRSSVFCWTPREHWSRAVSRH